MIRFLATLSLGLLLCGCSRCSDHDGQGAKPAASAVTQAASAQAGASSTASPAPTVAITADDPCVKTCTGMATTLGCKHPEQCMSKCQTLRNATVCKKQVEKFIDCMTGLEQRFWFCDEDGVPLMRLACEGEQGAISDCMMTNQGKL